MGSFLEGVILDIVDSGQPLPGYLLEQVLHGLYHSQQLGRRRNRDRKRLR
jgi:hypothetical protein